MFVDCIIIYDKDLTHSIKTDRTLDKRSKG